MRPIDEIEVALYGNRSVRVNEAWKKVCAQIATAEQVAVEMEIVVFDNNDTAIFRNWIVEWARRLRAEGKGA
ncbi:MAG: hypothetical protein KKD77_21550 [Gammaproteobacteria bacterium]|nr:hypothetical protein [Gammaproteobacteria bacterium]